ncbi:ribonuclease H-like domain-containing protein [Polychytrium aggregatum]|uniref:ribonuclease H-like domain-containing protein n=1 Tax=Polychytrium aggregatum TaxID=110093 RepID=UPI0022FEA796|nr:ribonuclease H-like domain-containing protein [Polychytrium aggregatum]KAI9205828.1 ribonuclease H-like domain-containing protein [Polychytrium aggregatum]
MFPRILGAIVCAIRLPQRRPRPACIRYVSYKAFICDTETTGFSPGRNQIIEMAIQEASCFAGPTRSNPQHISLLVNPKSHIANQHIHGISDQMVASAPVFATQWNRIVGFVQDRCGPGVAPLILAHNAKFDVRMINAELSPAQRLQLTHWRAACTLVGFLRPMVPLKKHSLAALSEHFGLSPVVHRALDDVRALDEIVARVSQGREDEILQLLVAKSFPFVSDQHPGCSCAAQDNVISRLPKDGPGPSRRPKSRAIKHAGSVRPLSDSSATHSGHEQPHTRDVQAITPTWPR